MTNLYVGNLPFSANEESVRALVAEFGAVHTFSLTSDRVSGTPRGFGFVEMSSDDAAKAMQGLNGKDFSGRPPQGERGSRPEPSGPESQSAVMRTCCG